MQKIVGKVDCGKSGLIEAEDKKDLKEKLKESIVLLSDLERETTNLEEEDSKGKFAVYIEEREKTALRKLIRSVRTKSFGTPEFTTPPRLYTNQSETANSILSAKKATLGYKKRKIFQSLILSKRYCNRRSAISQCCEIESNIGQSNEYRLNKKAEYLETPLKTWANLSMAQNRKYLDFIVI